MRLKKVAYNNNLSNEIMVEIKDLYIERCKEHAKQMPECQNLSSSEKDDFINNYLPDAINMYRSILEFDFLFTKIVDAIDTAAKEGMDNSGDVIVDNYLSDNHIER